MVNIQDVQEAIMKCEKGFWSFEKKHRVYYCNECECCTCDECSQKGKYYYKGDNKWHFWQGNPKHAVVTKEVIRKMVAIFECQRKIRK